MNKTDKYFKLMIMLIGGFFGFIALVVLIFFLLKLCSITLFHLPGFDHVYQFVVVVIPYLIFFSGYYYLHKKIPLSKSKSVVVVGRILLVIGSLLCAATMVLATLTLFGVQKRFLLTYQDNSQYGWILQVVILFFTALIIASGDGKEKDWMEKHNNEVIPIEPQP